MQSDSPEVGQRHSPRAPPALPGRRATAVPGRRAAAVLGLRGRRPPSLRPRVSDRTPGCASTPVRSTRDRPDGGRRRGRPAWPSTAAAQRCQRAAQRRRHGGRARQPARPPLRGRVRARLQSAWSASRPAPSSGCPRSRSARWRCPGPADRRRCGRSHARAARGLRSCCGQAQGRSRQRRVPPRGTRCRRRPRAVAPDRLALVAPARPGRRPRSRADRVRNRGAAACVRALRGRRPRDARADRAHAAARGRRPVPACDRWVRPDPHRAGGHPPERNDTLSPRASLPPVGVVAVLGSVVTE